MIPQGPLALNVSSPALNVSATKYFTASPAVYEMGDGYAVIWATNFSGTGYIKYNYLGVEHTVYDERNNIVRTNDTIHVVKVPYEHLQGNSYTVYSTEVTSHNYAITNYGTTISAGPITLKAYDGGTDDFDILVLTDTHSQLTWSKNAAAQFSKDPDLVVFSGDIVNSIESKTDIAAMFNIMGSVTGGKYPVVYCRGNHETRGIYATALLDYFPTKTGEFYFDFRYGPLWGVVMDTGEDKVDSHEYYGNLANYKEYNEKQEAWLRSLRMDTTADYRLGIYHIPGIGSLANGIDFTDSVHHLGLQFAVSGHDHKCRLVDGSNVGVAHDTYICGGYDRNAGTFITMNRNTQTAYITSKSDAGAICDGFNSYPVALSNEAGSVPEALEDPDYGTNAHFSPSAASAGTISISVQPTVFETGGDWYNIVWATASTNSTSKGSTGYVEYEYNGKTYQRFDEAGGYRRSCNNIHTVMVPKAHLNNNTYRVGSFLVHYSYVNPSTQAGRYYSSGDYVVSKDFVFENKSADEAVNLIACTDMKVISSDTTMLTAAQKAVEGLGTSPTLVLVNGDVVSIALNSNSDLIDFFSGTAAISGGMHPVVFSRGNSECRGYLATDLIKYIPTVTGEFYYSFTCGEYTFVNIDTAEDDPDDQLIEWQGSTVKKYGNRVTFDKLRQEQLDWFSSLPQEKIVAISHIPLSKLKSHFGLDYEPVLKAKGAVLCISGHDTVYSLKETVDEDSIYTIIAGGFNSSAAHHIAVSVLLSDDYAYINACKYLNSATTYPDSKTVSLSTGNTLTHSVSQPPMVNGIYMLSTPAHINWISRYCLSTTSYAGKTFKMSNDIDMMLVPFTPIGGNDDVSADNNTSSAAFAGTFDGNGYQIKNLNIVTSNNNVGFFGVVRNGTVKNLTLSAGMVDGGWYIGGLAGASYGAVYENCYCDVMVFSESGSKVAGITGFLSHGSIINRCANFGSVSAHHVGGSAAGIAGQIYSATVNDINNSYNRGNIAAHGETAIAGGIFGYAGNVAVAVKNCYNAASVACPGSQGAVLGSYSNSANLTVSNSYFTAGFNGADTATKDSNTWSSVNGTGTIPSLTMDAMRSQATAALLSADDFVYVPTLNDGYPIHKNDPRINTIILLSNDSRYILENGFIKGIAAGTSIDEIRNNIVNDSGISISTAATGGTITLTVDGVVADSAVIIILGDVDGNGCVDTTDYLRVKNAVLGRFTLDDTAFVAADINENGEIDSDDLAAIKNHFLGTHNLYA